MGLYKGLKNLDLSEQKLLDCTSGNGVAHCNGNWPDDIYDYQKSSGQVLEKDYKYENKHGTCRASGKSRAITLRLLKGMRICLKNTSPNMEQLASF